MPPEPSARFVIIDGPQAGRSFDLDASGDGPWVIGRDPWTSVPLHSDRYVSRENAVVRRQGAHWEVMDLPDSTNGTQLNGRPLEKGVPSPLRLGDVVRVGRTALRLEWMGILEAPEDRS